MTETLTAGTTVAQLRAHVFHQWLSDAALFAGGGSGVPQIEQVHITCDGKNLLALASDRYVLGVSRYVPVTNDGPVASDRVFAFNLTLDDVANVLRTAKTPIRDQQWRHVFISTWTLAGDESGKQFVKFTFNSGETLQVTASAASFPSWRNLIPGSGTQTARAATEYNPTQLVKFAKVGDKRSVIRLTTFVNSDGDIQKPTTVRIGDNFFGLIMPGNPRGELIDDQFTQPDWLGA